MELWMQWLTKHIGEHEITGTNHNNPFIVSLFKHTTYFTSNDETPWCAACACAALEENGYMSPHRADAISFSKAGSPCELKPGCIVVIRHPSGGHHVTFCDSIVDEHYFVGLGGNQSDCLKKSTYKRSEVIATRWPDKR
jgi:uncharacterized protein (TIGR02594 family)